MNNVKKNKWFISLMVLIGIVIGMAISFVSEIILFNNHETKITKQEYIITYEDLQHYAGGSETISTMGK